MNLNDKIVINENTYNFTNLDLISDDKKTKLDKLPYSLRVLLENICRKSKHKNIDNFLKWIDEKGKNPVEIDFYPARVLMQDFTGVPAVVDLAAMRDNAKQPKKINPQIPVDLVIDHSLIIDHYGNNDASKLNTQLEFNRNLERYKFLKWGQENFDNFKVVPPGVGICHQVNIEYLAQTIFHKKLFENEYELYPDTVVGTDSHTTMVNALSVLGWGVGGIEAESALLGQPMSMLIPEVIGVKLTGKLPRGSNATDLVLKIVKVLREKGVVEKFVEFYGDGLDNLSVADRATISNMAPEYGATCGFFPIDNETIKYLKLTGRKAEMLEAIETYAKINGFWRNNEERIYTDIVELDLNTIVPSISGPKKPHEMIRLEDAKDHVYNVFNEEYHVDLKGANDKKDKIRSGDILIASITSCTNTSNPYLLVAAGLVAKKANEIGLKPKPWVKTSLAPGSQVVTEYLTKSGLQAHLDEIGFNTVGYGCTTCIGNSGPLDPNISKQVKDNNLACAAVLSGNRNFEGRINPDIKANFLASPPLVVLYSFVGNMYSDIMNEPINYINGKPIFYSDLMPSKEEIEDIINLHVNSEIYETKYANVYEGDENWKSIDIPKSDKYHWDEKSTYIKCPPYFKKQENAIKDLKLTPLAVFGDMITTDHISPAGSFNETSAAGKYLIEHNVTKKDFNSYGSRRGNHEVMMRGTFANIRIKNELIEKAGGYTKYNDQELTIYDAATNYKNDNKETIVIAGKLYGAGSSRDWAAKGTKLLGIKAVVAESFERIHRSNLVGMGVIPFEFTNGENRTTINANDIQQITINLTKDVKLLSEIESVIKYNNGTEKNIKLLFKVYTDTEMEYLKTGGVLNYVLNKLN